MSPLAGKILIVGVPLVISLSWFAFWVIRLARAAKRLKSSGAPQRMKEQVPPDPVQQPPAEGGW